MTHLIGFLHGTSEGVGIEMIHSSRTGGLVHRHHVGHRSGAIHGSGGLNAAERRRAGDRQSVHVDRARGAVLGGQGDATITRRGIADGLKAFETSDFGVGYQGAAGDLVDLVVEQVIDLSLVIVAAQIDRTTGVVPTVGGRIGGRLNVDHIVAGLNVHAMDIRATGSANVVHVTHFGSDRAIGDRRHKCREALIGVFEVDRAD